MFSAVSFVKNKSKVENVRKLMADFWVPCCMLSMDGGNYYCPCSPLIFRCRAVCCRWPNRLKCVWGVLVDYRCKYLSTCVDASIGSARKAHFEVAYVFPPHHAPWIARLLHPSYLRLARSVFIWFWPTHSHTC